MTFSARVLRVLVASPSDTGEARRLLREAVEDWSALHSEQTGIVLLPLLWERDSAPEMGAPAQEVLNRQLADKADLVIATFWTRLGTPTGDAESGSAEEIRRAIKAGKRVLLYFSTIPVVPDNLDSDQWTRLKEFRAEMEQQGLVDTYEDLSELFRKVSAALTRTVREGFGATVDDVSHWQGGARLNRQNRKRVNNVHRVSGPDQTQDRSLSRDRECWLRASQQRTSPTCCTVVGRAASRTF
jgi:hypothetical protein